MHWYSPSKANASLDDYASAQHPTKQDARSQSLLREHTRLQDTLSAYHASIHIRLFLLDMLPSPPTDAQLDEWLTTLEQDTRTNSCT
jgi:N-dimethylarginine dimethylaminohydrolase